MEGPKYGRTEFFSFFLRRLAVLSLLNDTYDKFEHTTSLNYGGSQIIDLIIEKDFLSIGLSILRSYSRKLNQMNRAEI